MYIALQDMLTQIESCNFQCEAGDLRNNTGFKQLVALAAEAEKYREAYYQSQSELDGLRCPPGCWGTVSSFIQEHARALIEEARDLLLQFHEPDTGQLRTRTQGEIDEWMARAAGILHTVVTMEAHLPAPDAGEKEER